MKPATSLPLLAFLTSTCLALFRLTSTHPTPPQEKLLGNTSPDLLTVLQLQVELLRRSRKYAEAEHVCTRALGICGAAYGPSDVQVAFWKNQLAQVRYVCRLTVSHGFAPSQHQHGWGHGGPWQERAAVHTASKFHATYAAACSVQLPSRVMHDM